MSERKILVVDDDIVILRSLSKHFTTILPGCLILTAMSGNDGLNKIKTQNPDIALIDVRLGKESGMDLLKEFYEHANLHWNRAPRFIVMTAYEDEEVKKNALEKYKVDAFLRKPFAEGEIEEAVLTSLEKAIVASHENELKEMKENCDRELKERGEKYDRELKEKKERYEHEIREVRFARKVMSDKKDRAIKVQEQVKQDKLRLEAKKAAREKGGENIKGESGGGGKK